MSRFTSQREPILSDAARPATTRIQALDLIRGVSVLGILAVNVDGFAGPMFASLNPSLWMFPNQGATALSFWVMDTFFHEKFVALFSMLFGISLFLVGGERSDSRRNKILARRLFILFLFGMLHGFGIWWGDILSLYAVTGSLMYFCRSWRPRTLLCIGVVLFTGATASHHPIPVAPMSATQKAQAQARLRPDPVAIAKTKAAIASTLAEAKSSWKGAYAVNTRQYLQLLSGYPSLLPSTLGLMMIGLSLFKSGFIAGRASDRRYLAMIAAASVALLLVGWLCWKKDIAATPVLGGDGLVALCAPLVGLGYAAALILLLRAGASRVVEPFASAGRMAFTNYLTQSVIMTSVFYGGRGALMGEFDRPALWGMVTAVWVLQLAWSPWWLYRFEMGPFEWVWRCLTVGHRVPLRKAP
jgi:uncharacterized protein